MRPQAQLVDLVLALVVEKVSITSAVNTSPLSRNRGPPRARRAPPRASRASTAPCEFLRRQVVDVLVERLARVDLVLDAVEPGHQHGGEREVRIAGRIRAAELDALGLRAWRVHRDADAAERLRCE